MGEIDLPKGSNGEYLDMYAKIYLDDEDLLRKYAKRIREAYKVDSFEINTNMRGILKFYRECNKLNLDEIRKDYLMYDIFLEGIEYLNGESIGTIQIDKNKKEFGIQIFYQVKERGYATEIWNKATEIMKKIGIEDYREYRIYTFVNKATDHLLGKYGNPFDVNR